MFIICRAAQTIGDSNLVNEVMKNFEEALDKFPKCVETYALFAQVKPCLTRVNWSQFASMCELVPRVKT